MSIGLAKRALSNPTHIPLLSQFTNTAFQNFPLALLQRNSRGSGNAVTYLNQTTGAALGTTAEVQPTATDHGYFTQPSSAVASSGAGQGQNLDAVVMWQFSNFASRVITLSSTNVRYWIGIFGKTSPLSFATLGADNPSIANPTMQWIAFRYSVGVDTTWQCGLAGASGGAKFFGTNVALDTTKTHVFSFSQTNRGGGTTNYFIDGQKVGSLHPNGNYTASQYMPYVVWADNKGVAVSVSVGWNNIIALG